MILTSTILITSTPAQTDVASVLLSIMRPIKPASYTTSVITATPHLTENETAAAQERVQALEEEIHQIRTSD